MTLSRPEMTTATEAAARTRIYELEQSVTDLRAELEALKAQPAIDHAAIAAELHRLQVEAAAERARDPAVQARSFRSTFGGGEGRGR